MENVSAILVDLDTQLLFGIDIACNVIPFFDHITLLSFFLHLVGKNRAEQTGPHDEIIIFFHRTSLWYTF